MIASPLFRTVVAGTDGRPGGQEALRLARRLAAPEATIIVCSVAMDSRNTDAARRAVDEAREGLHGLHGEVVVAGSVAEGLHDVATEHDADLLVVGSSHRGLAGRVLLGDDAVHTVRHAPCAVAVAPRGYPGDVALRTIGVGYDRRPTSEHALAVARELAEATGATLRARHVVAVGTWVTPPNAYAGSAIDEEVRTARESIAALQGVEGDVEVGFPADDLARFAEDLDLLVVGSSDRSGLGRVLLGSTAEMLTGRSAAPLLVVPGVGDADPA